MIWSLLTWLAEFPVNLILSHIGLRPTFRFRRVSETEVRSVTFQNGPSSMMEVKSKMASSLGVEVTLCDVIYGIRVADGDDEPAPHNDDVIEIVVHRTLRTIPEGERTEEEDMFEGSMADGDRIRMSCGHAATPDNIYRHCWVKLKGNDIKFNCSRCNTAWDLNEIGRKACLSEDEYAFSMKMSRLYIFDSMDGRECPACRSFCIRNDVTDNLAVCLVCQKAGKSHVTFCWECSELLTSRPHICARRHTQELLNNCERVKMEYSNIENVPSIRACPECKRFLEHTGACKTMTCHCQHVFCFSCLKPADSRGQLQCGNYCSVCEVAPIQIID